MPQGTEKTDICSRLRETGLRPTRQRLALGELLFGQGDRHVTAEMLHEDAVRNKVPVSLATVYNTLHQFTQAGLLREVSVDRSKTYFDTNVTSHHHFYCEHSGTLFDVPDNQIGIVGLPVAPDGMEITRIDVVVRVTKKSTNDAT
ncbi:peroxide operon regulator [bacterium MnTg02]|nr:peroxide operon regulator [bacterium MnTg02]